MKPGEKVVFPLRAGAHFRRFNIKQCNTVDLERVKEALYSFEKDTLLLNLIPIAFDIDLDTQIQVNNLFADQETLSALFGILLSSPSDITEVQWGYTKIRTIVFWNLTIITWNTPHF